MPKEKNSHSTAQQKLGQLGLDMPLVPASALSEDKLARSSFARIAADHLRQVPSTAGLVVSVEGAWGSGKSSTLALIEALITEESTQSKPLIVHFNPWLIGDKDSLLRHFLNRIATTIKMSDGSRDGKKVAKEIKAYAKVFDFVKYLPGAEPWASIIKSVMEAGGTAAESIAEYKTPDIEQYKQRVEDALKKLDRPVIVFIDDIDRLYPSEVFEMVRVIKAVGGLPRIGYVLAWDASYVSSALEKLGVPYASTYLDKVVQVRMPLPQLTLKARLTLINDALAELPPEATLPRFKGQEERLGSLYTSGLRSLLSQPRDIVRVFNAVKMIEPLLRDEIVFSDILGLAALSVKAPEVYNLIRTQPALFVGTLSPDIEIKDRSTVIKEGTAARRNAYAAQGNEDATRNIVHFLFPDVAPAEEAISLGSENYAGGTISHPARLNIALQLSLSDDDISIKAAKNFLQQPLQRENIIAGLNKKNCHDFLSALGDVAHMLDGEGILDLEELCIKIAKLIDTNLFIDRDRAHLGMIAPSTLYAALKAIITIITVVDSEKRDRVLQKISINAQALSCAGEILASSHMSKAKDHIYQSLQLKDEIKEKSLEAFIDNVKQTVQQGQLGNTLNPGNLLRWVARMKPKECPRLLSLMKEQDPHLDLFAMWLLGTYSDSFKGRAYRLPKENDLEAFLPLENFKTYASERLNDPDLDYPAKAAWRSVVEDSCLYGLDGSKAGF